MLSSLSIDDSKRVPSLSVAGSQSSVSAEERNNDVLKRMKYKRVASVI